MVHHFILRLFIYKNANMTFLHSFKLVLEGITFVGFFTISLQKSAHLRS